jgi:hypothetical protein
MIKLDELKPYFGDGELNASMDHNQIKVFFKIFLDDFITSPIIINGKKIRIDQKKPKPREFADYSETFFHIITKDSDYYNRRLYECNRANRIHWIKPILLSHPCEKIFYYKWRDDNGICKEHFWYFDKNFMVVLRPISAELQIVTAFCVEQENNITYYERYKDFKEGKCTC